MIALNKRTIILAVILIMFSAVVLLSMELFISYKKAQIVEDTLMTYQYNDKIISFSKLFIDKVLKAESDVSFEDRLQLENSVRDINNKDILAQWQKFTDSKNESQAQEEVKNLLYLLVNKISY